MIKLIVSDIDGTLVEDGNNTMNPEVLDTIKILRTQGIQFAAASGRQWASIEQIFEPVKEKIFYLSDNGAYVGCHGRNLFLNTIERSLIMDVVREARCNKELDLVLSGPDYVYTETKNHAFVDWLIHGYRFQVREVEDLMLVEDQFIKISVYKADGVEEAAKSLMEKYKDQLKITISGDMWMDCMALGINKGQAVSLLQESLDIKPEETMAFGDQSNDIEMLEQAYYSFAVGNAREEVKKVARFQTDTNKNDGVLKVLRTLLT